METETSTARCETNPLRSSAKVLGDRGATTHGTTRVRILAQPGRYRAHYVLATLMTTTLAVACGTTAPPSDDENTPIILNDAGNEDGHTGGLDDATIAPDAPPTADTGTRVDAGGVDVGNPTLDIGIDEPSQDGGEPPDGDLICPPMSTSCDGNVLVTCSDDGTRVGRTRCSALGNICALVDASGTADCVAPSSVCSPGLLFCTDGGSSARCSEDGAVVEQLEPCEAGCDAETGRCIEDAPSCPLASIVDLEPGSVRVNMCDASGTFSYLEQDDQYGLCRVFDFPSRDVMFRFTVDEPSLVRIDVRDDDGRAAIDTVAYLRATCDDTSSQLACSDDIPCNEATPGLGGCNGSVQPRQSRISIELDPGEYYLVAAILLYRSSSTGTQFTCGNIRVALDVNSR